MFILAVREKEVKKNIPSFRKRRLICCTMPISLAENTACAKFLLNMLKHQAQTISTVQVEMILPTDKIVRVIRLNRKKSLTQNINTAIFPGKLIFLCDSLFCAILSRKEIREGK